MPERDFDPDEILSGLSSSDLARLKAKIESEPQCLKCGAPALSWQKYCGACGLENPRFDEAVFRHEMGMGLEQMLKTYCKSGEHYPREGQGITKYCIYCGQNFGN